MQERPHPLGLEVSMICAPRAHVKALLLLTLWVTLSGGGSPAAAQGSLDRLPLPEGGQVYWEEDRLSYLVDARASERTFSRLSLTLFNPPKSGTNVRYASTSYAGASPGCSTTGFVQYRIDSGTRTGHA